MNPHIAGMRDFFGGKMGRFVRKQLAHLSPIDLAESEARTKLRSAFGRNLPRTANRPEAVLETGRGFWGGVSDMFSYGAEQGKKVSGQYTLGDYFTGKNFADVEPGLRTGNLAGSMARGGHPDRLALQRKRMMYRLGVPGVVAGGAVLDFGIGENPISNVGRAGLTAGATVGTGVALARFGGAAGTVGAAALFGYSAINALRGGDQIGPF